MRRAPRVAWLCALAAVVSAFGWSLITPAWHVPDEVSHFAYAQYLAETADLPRHNGDVRYSPEEEAAIGATDFYLVVGRPDARPPATQAVRERLAAIDASRVGTGNAQSATNNPPLYYALTAPAYWAGSGLGILDRLWLMRLVGVLLAGGTAFATALFLREVLPSAPWAWTVGGLAVALQPLFGHVSSGVQADALLYFAGALTLYAMARVLRRGLDVRQGVLLGIAVAIGMLAKLTFVGLVPAAAVCLLVGLWRARRGRPAPGAVPATAAAAGGRRGAVRGAALGVAIPAIALGIYVIGCLTFWDRPIYGGEPPGTPGLASGRATPFNVAELASYTWQLYLPRLPFMQDLLPDVPLWKLWTHGVVGRFGWLDTLWPAWVYTLGGVLLGAVGLLALAGLARAGLFARLRDRGADALVFGTAVAGLLVLIAAAGYAARRGGAEPFEQARYLLPLLPLYGVVVALAARAAGPRWGPVLGGVLVVMALGHDLFAQLLTVGRFYG